MIIAMTGHRPSKLNNDYDLTSPLINKIALQLQKAIEFYKPTQMISGMALGIDTLWAELAILEQIPLLAALPCKNHSSKWPQKSVNRYNDILNNLLTEIVYVSDKEYDNTCMQKRNEYMVDQADLLIGVWDGSSGGTGNCIKYAKSKNKQILIINPNHYK